MKSLSRVVWSEGMHLGPHHFQAQSRYFEDFVNFTTSSLWFESYGLIGYELDSEALRNGTLALIHARGIFPDGLAFHMKECEPLPPPRQIADLFPPLRDSVEFSLAVAVRHEEGLNCALTPEEISPDVRYIARDAALRDENTGRDERPVSLGRKNIQVLLDTEPHEGAVTLPLGRVKRDGSGQFVFDQNFVPPCLQISASPRIMTMLRRLIESLEEKCRATAKPKDLGSPSASGFSAQGIGNAWFLHCINSSLAPLRHLCFSKHAHPQELYMELSRLAGALCTFGLESHPSSLPLYNHRRLGDCLEALDDHIRTHLELVVPSNCIPIPLIPAAKYFYEGRITDQRTLSRSRWVFGVRSPIGEADLISKTPRLVKICSKEFLPRLVSSALPGLKLSHLPVPPPAISPRVESQYFSIDKAGPCWEHMSVTRELGVYVPGDIPDPEAELFVIIES